MSITILNTQKNGFDILLYPPLTNTPLIHMTAYWGIRLGEGGKYVDEGYSKKFIAIGWNELGDLSWLLSSASEEDALKKLKVLHKRIYENVTNSQVGIQCGEILRFVRTIKHGDIFLLPNPSKRSVIIGRISGDYQWKENWGDKCPYTNRRNVEWVRSIPRSELSTKLKNSLVWLTVISLEEHKIEVESLISEKSSANLQNPITQVTGQDIHSRIIERLLSMNPRQFEEFTSHLLSISGFEAANRQYVGDKGIDIDGYLSTELVTLDLKVQVKQVPKPIGNTVVLQLRGALGTDEHGAIVTIGTFTRPAIEEAEASGKKNIKLIDQDSLVDWILSHYDNLDDQYKSFFDLKKKDIPLIDQFYLE
nr:restriction endonuclease [uncultured Methanoregula sp.]